MSRRRPTIPPQVDDGERSIMEFCWRHAQEDRPVFLGILADWQQVIEGGCCSFDPQVSKHVCRGFVR